MNRLAFEPIFDSWPVVLAIVVVLFAVPFLVAVQGDQVDRRRRRALMLLRCAAALFLVIAAIRPAVLSHDTLPSRATLAVLLDLSRSMTLPAEEDRSRWEVQREVWRTLAPSLEQLDESLDVQVLGYSGEAVDLGLDPAVLAGDEAPEPTGRATDLSAALSGALRAASGQPLAGVVLIGDGVHNPPRGRDAADAAAGDAGSSARSVGDPQAVARTLASLDVPLWTVGIGPPGDADQVRDAAVEELAQTFNVFSGNEFDVDFVIRSRALEGVALPVRVQMIDEDNPDRAIEVATRRHTPRRTVETASMSIPVVAPEPGTYRLEVTVEPQDGETLLTNNTQSAFVDVREGGGRILYLEGQPRPEQAFIRRALRRFPDLELTYRWIPADGPADWPVDLSDLLRPGRFDIFLLGDLPAEALGDMQLRALADAVEAGSGLLAIGGLQAFDAGGYAATPLADVLPIQLGGTRRGGGKDSQLSGPISPQVTTAHPILSLDPTDPSPAAQQDFWDRLPPLVGANRFGPPRVAPGIQVLMQTPDEDPLLVTGEYGRGRVIAFAGDSTWQWWRQGQDAAHRRFWRQMMLWLMDRGDDRDMMLTIDLPERRFDAGYAAQWTVTHAAGEGAELTLEAVAADGTAVPVEGEYAEATPAGDGVEPSTTLSGAMPELPAGIHRLRATLRPAATDAEEIVSEKAFQVVDDDRELAQPYADLSYLAQLAGQTAASGGASYSPAQIDDLIARIAELRRTSASPVVRKYRLGDGPASAWPLFLGVVGLLTAEWVLRRRWGLA